MSMSGRHGLHPPMAATAVALLVATAFFSDGARADDYMAPYVGIAGSISGTKLNIATIDTAASVAVQLRMSGTANSLVATQSGQVSILAVSQAGDDNSVTATQSSAFDLLSVEQKPRERGGGGKPSLQIHTTPDGTRVTSYTSAEIGLFIVDNVSDPRGYLGR